VFLFHKALNSDCSSAVNFAQELSYLKIVANCAFLASLVATVKIYFLFLAHVILRGLLARHHFCGFWSGFYPLRILVRFWSLSEDADYNRSENKSCFLIGCSLLEQIWRYYLRFRKMMISGEEIETTSLKIIKI